MVSVAVFMLVSGTLVPKVVFVALVRNRLTSNGPFVTALSVTVTVKLLLAVSPSAQVRVPDVLT